MKYYALILVASAALAQSLSKTYTTDLNGHRVETPQVASSDHTQTEITQNLNGRRVPLQQTEERVLRKEGNLTVTERIVRKFDANGQVALTDRQIIEAAKRPNGSTTHITTYRTDVNGREREAERQTTETETQGSVTKMQSSIDRPSLSGSFETVEKRSGVTETTPGGAREDQTIYQRSENGGYVVRAREVKESSHSGNQATEKSALYQPLGSSGQLQLTEQSVSNTTARPDGSQTVQTELYGASWNGRVGDSQSGPSLREQDLIERTPGPGGSVTESLSVRRPTAADPNKLGPLTKISETVCTGKFRDQ